MKIVLNGEAYTLPSNTTTLTDLMTELGLSSDGRIIEVDRVILQPSDWSRTVLSAGSEVEIIQFMGGG